MPELEDYKILDADLEGKKVSDLVKRPTDGITSGGGGFSWQVLQAMFDAVPALIVARFNSLITAIRAALTAGTVTATTLDTDDTAPATVQGKLAWLLGKIKAVVLGDIPDQTITGNKLVENIGLTGAPTAATPVASDNSTKLATTEFSAPRGHTHDGATTEAPGFMSTTDKTKLDGVESGATNYTHPANHAPSIITQDASNRFATDAEKTAWNGMTPNNGWILVNDSWAYASASTITVPSGAAMLYQKGDKLRFYQNSAWKYFYVIAVADTTLTIALTSDYTLTSSAISTHYYSKAENPQYWPGWLSFATTITGFAAGYTNSGMRYKIIGSQCFINFKGVTGTSNATSVGISLPVAPAYENYLIGWCATKDNGAYVPSPGQMWGGPSVAVITIYKAFLGDLFTTSGIKAVWIGVFSYEF